jgi:hypothetical protein
MASAENPNIPRAHKPGTGVTRRDLLKGAASLSVASALVTECGAAAADASPFSGATLRCASELSGATLSEERIRAMRLIFDVNMKHIQILREFDPADAEPATIFSV